MNILVRLIVLIPVVSVWTILSIASQSMQEIPWQIVLLCAAVFGKDALELVNTLRGK